MAISKVWLDVYGERAFGRLNEFSPDILGAMVWYGHPWEKNNKHAAVIFLLAENIKFCIFVAWNLYSVALWYAESDVMLFIKINRFLRVFPTFSENQANFPRLFTVDG